MVIYIPAAKPATKLIIISIISIYFCPLGVPFGLVTKNNPPGFVNSLFMFNLNYNGVR